MKIKINGEKYHLYRDKTGPYDYYYYHGNFFDTIPNKTKVSKTFDMFGDHIAIVRRYIPVVTYVWLLIPVILLALISAFWWLQPRTEACVLYKPHDIYVASDGSLCLEILNKNEDSVYIYVGDVVYEVYPGAFVGNVPYHNEQSVIIKYHDTFYEEVIK